MISFHSLEDRIVKTFIARHGRGEVDRRAPMAEPAPALLKPLARVRPGDEETRANPRARSATLRVAERTEVPLPLVAAQSQGRLRAREPRGRAGRGRA